MQIKLERLPQRCEICHQADQFEPLTNCCARCANLLPVIQTDKPLLPGDWQQIAFGILGMTIMLIPVVLLTNDEPQIFWYHLVKSLFNLTIWLVVISGSSILLSMVIKWLRTKIARS